MNIATPAAGIQIHRSSLCRTRTPLAEKNPLSVIGET